MKRKLTAIMSADVKDYSRLMGQNEEATVQTLRHSRELITARIQSHDGRVVDTPGDNLLAEFRSAVDALACAVEVQTELDRANAQRPPERQMYFRIGINIGDVLTENGRIYGDGVNIAARIEGLAEPGGICISRGVYDQVHRKIDLVYTDLGDKQVKNIIEPVRVYKVSTETGALGRPIRSTAGVDANNRRRQGLFLGIIGSVLVLGIALWFGHYFGWTDGFQKWRDSARLPVASAEKPSIAVLPFENLGPSSSED